ncbi:sugar kinase, ribokinase family [Mycolicibacterium canariasense]|uniref:Sugar kinase, ribokinase family n=1 Tax=Mycolicibacterium canariasense TaxID=228230 RepID=A0A100WIS1_MYCCR|nr:sugar kinase [Mycolicibacterium canariasense]MCV7208302.1 sugar kinase [Mycolicibacterium canariasense]ORV09584.1 ribokinase [Mycolicibacterium canariasense]GAS98951.1 sugar kinase, ribokinase family [Mycolicibacterium canariasense]
MTARVATLGETMALMRTRDIGSLRHVSDLILGIGGAESNVAIGLQRLGIDSRWLGRVGDDPLGERVTREIRAEGVDVHGVIDPDAPTGLMIKERPTTRSTAVLYYRGGSAGSRLRPDDVPTGWIEHVSVLHVSGITALLSDSARDCMQSALDRARGAGVRISFDINYRSALAPADVAGPLLRKFAEQADIVFGGPEELHVLFPDSDPAEAAARLVRSGRSEVVRKQGADGATVHLPGEQIHGAGIPVDVVDTVGAGDAFVAGYLSGWLHGLSVAQRLRRANACGAILCMTPGDWESSPTLADVERFCLGGDPVLR